MSEPRQLAAILFADIVGYTRLMQVNELDAISKLNYFKEVLEIRASENLGKIIQYYGDGCLIIFNSPIEAITFAKIVQEDFSKVSHLPVRIGIHLGDLFFKEGNVFGHSVNVTSRIESMGVPGAVLLSDAVNNQIRNQPQFITTSLGKFNFKNIEKPIEVFALANEGFPVPKKKLLEGKQAKKIGNNPMLLAAISFILLVLFAFYVYKNLNSKNDQYSIDKSIAVLPFTDMSPDKDQGYLGDGLAEEIINSLFHIPGLQVAGRTSSFVYRERNMDLKLIGKELDVGIILEGSIQKYGDKIRVTAQLINTKTGYHLWSEHYDRDMKDIFEIQDEIARNITEQMKLTISDVHSLANKSNKVSPQAYEMYLKGMQLLNGDQTEFEKAIPYFETAIRIDSTYALAYAMLGYNYARMGWWDVMTPRDAFEKMYTFAKKSIELDPELAIGYAVMGSAKLHGNYDWSGAKENFETSLALDSLNSVALTEYAYYNVYSRNFDEGFRLAEKNVALDPANSFKLIDIGYMYAYSGKPEMAQKIYRKIRELYPNKVDGYFEQFGLYANQHKFDSAYYYYHLAVKRGLKEKTKYTLFEVSRLLQEGKKSEAESIFNKNKNEVKAMDKASIFALFNKFDEMMEYLEIAYLERDDDLFIIRAKKEFDRFRSTPEFEEFIKKLNFPISKNE